MSTINHRIQALAPISHGDIGADSGNVMRFRRIPILSISGVPVYVPAISAGALRGVVRRLLWRDVFDACELSRETVGSPKWDRLYAALANGGTIESSEKRVSPDAIRGRRAAMPILSMLGAALYSSHMAGLAYISNSWLSCAEGGNEDAPAMRDLLADESRVRHVDREEQDPDVSGVGPMPTTTETVIAGSTFVGHARIAAELEASAWAAGLDMVTHLGGKGGQGFGNVKIKHDGDGQRYREWMSSVDEIREALLVLADELVVAGKPKKSRPKKKADAAPVGTPAPGELF